MGSPGPALGVCATSVFGDRMALGRRCLPPPLAPLRPPGKGVTHSPGAWMAPTSEASGVLVSAGTSARCLTVNPGAASVHYRGETVRLVVLAVFGGGVVTNGPGSLVNLDWVLLGATRPGSGIGVVVPCSTLKSGPQRSHVPGPGT